MVFELLGKCWPDRKSDPGLPNLDSLVLIDVGWESDHIPRRDYPEEGIQFSPPGHAELVSRFRRND